MSEVVQEPVNSEALDFMTGYKTHAHQDPSFHWLSRTQSQWESSSPGSPWLTFCLRITLFRPLYFTPLLITIFPCPILILPFLPAAYPMLAMINLIHPYPSLLHCLVPPPLHRLKFLGITTCQAPRLTKHPGKTISGARLTFQLHLGLMITGVCLLSIHLLHIPQCLGRMARRVCLPSHPTKHLGLMIIGMYLLPHGELHHLAPAPNPRHHTFPPFLCLNCLTIGLLSCQVNLLTIWLALLPGLRTAIPTFHL